MRIAEYFDYNPLLSVKSCWEGQQKVIAKEFGKEGLAFHHGLFLLALFFEKKGPIFPGTLAKFFHLGKSKVSVILTDLEEAGLIKRELDTKDARSFVISLTEKGKTKARHLIAPLEKTQTMLEEKVGSQNLLHLMRLLDEVTVIMEESFREEGAHE